MDENNIDKKLDLILTTLNSKIDSLSEKLDTKVDSVRFEKSLDLILKKLDAKADNLNVEMKFNQVFQKLENMERLLNDVWVKQIDMNEQLEIIKDAISSHTTKFEDLGNIIDTHSAKIERLDVRLSILETRKK